MSNKHIYYIYKDSEKINSLHSVYILNNPPKSGVENSIADHVHSHTHIHIYKNPMGKHICTEIHIDLNRWAFFVVVLC